MSRYMSRDHAQGPDLNTIEGVVLQTYVSKLGLEVAWQDEEGRWGSRDPDTGAFNGVVGMTDDPLATLSLGESARLSIYNDTSFPHAMHLHGMHFREVLEGGGLGPSRDTLLMGGGERREIAFLADNPGKWLFHCHMLSHAASGMTTWIRVT